ncbi:MAG TPA: hypothetical protein VMQ93_17320 [Novosphingobium sp.]|nr:hypothetical protein [Novosphingobium sp.]
MPDLPPAENYQIVEALVECGLDRGGFSVTHDDTVEDDFVRIGASTVVVPEQFACIRKATSGSVLWFDNNTTGEGYGAYVASRVRPEASAAARQELARQGRLAALPELSRYASTFDFAQAVEGFCGVRPGQVLVRQGEDEWEIRPPRDAKGRVANGAFKKIGCVFNALMAQPEDLSRHGFNFGFIGNEAVSPPAD